MQMNVPLPSHRELIEACFVDVMTLLFTMSLVHKGRWLIEFFFQDRVTSFLDSSKMSDQPRSTSTIELIIKAFVHGRFVSTCEQNFHLNVDKLLVRASNEWKRCLILQWLLTPWATPLTNWLIIVLIIVVLELVDLIISCSTRRTLI